MTLTDTREVQEVAAASKRLRITLWVVQILLALVFTVTGTMKLVEPIAVLAGAFDWPGHVPPAFVRFVGFSELLGAAGLILPAATRIVPPLTALAAGCLTLVMALASLVHICLGEFAMLPVPLGIGALCAFVAWGRSTRATIPPR